MPQPHKWCWEAGKAAAARGHVRATRELPREHILERANLRLAYINLMPDATIRAKLWCQRLAAQKNIQLKAFPKGKELSEMAPVHILSVNLLKLAPSMQRRKWPENALLHLNSGYYFLNVIFRYSKRNYINPRHLPNTQSFVKVLYNLLNQTTLL